MPPQPFSDSRLHDHVWSTPNALACGRTATACDVALFQFGTFARGECSGPATLDLIFL
jgi:hypothetical protein